MKNLYLVFFLLCSGTAFSQAILQTADSFVMNGDYQSAHDFLEKNSGSSPSEQFLLDNKKIEVLIKLGNLEHSAELIQKLLAKAGSPTEKNLVDVSLGFLYINQGRYDLAIETLEKAITSLERDNKIKSLEGAQALTFFGQALKYIGKDHQAIEQLQMALTIRRNFVEEKSELIAASLNDLGLAYAGFDNDKALDYYELALEIYRQLHGNDHPKIAIAGINIGFIYKNMELYGDAVNNFELALGIWEKVHPGPHATKAFALLNLGDTYQRMGDNKAALSYYEKSLVMYKKSYGDKHPELADVLNKLGNLELTFGQYAKALQYFQQAISTNVPGFSESNVIANPPLTNYYNGKVLLYSLLYKAQAFEKRYHGKTLKFDDLKKSLVTLQLCDSLIDKLRQETNHESDKLSLGNLASEVYADAVRVANEASQNTPSGRNYRHLAFYFAEKSKSAMLLEAISDADAKSFAGIPAELLEEEKQLKSKIALTAQQLVSKPDADKESLLRDQAFQLNRSYQAFISKLESEFPEYFDLKFNTVSPSVQQLQNILTPGTAVLSYFMDEKESRLYIFSITGNSLKIDTKPIPKDFNKNITGLRNGILFNEITTFRKAATTLGKLLLSNVPPDSQHLIILPTGRLSTIPFETLLTGRQDERSNFNSCTYAVKKYSMSYEFSTALLLQKQKNKKSNITPSILLCAPVTFPKQDLPALPGSESEVTGIKNLFGQKNLRVSARIGPDANESFIKQIPFSDYNILHFATHGVVDESHPELSRIFLNADSGNDDGDLYSSEIYNLKINANLVTLSACQTGLGKISKGEGVIGLSRALVYAGAKNIIVSFWSVADESTSTLMKDFYDDLLTRSSTDYSSSLRKAKLDLIASSDYSSPYYWAPFILIGY